MTTPTRVKNNTTVAPAREIAILAMLSFSIAMWFLSESIVLLTMSLQFCGIAIG